MAKRFIDTNIFRKSFIKTIPVEAKLFYVYLFCECDHCGVWEVEFEVAKVRLGLSYLTEAEVLNYFNDKIVVFNNGSKWFLPQFVKFQYGELKANNKIHKSVLNNLTKFNLIEVLNNYDDFKELVNPYQTIKDKVKDKVKDKETDKDKDNPEINLNGLNGETVLNTGVSTSKRKSTVKTDKNAVKNELYQQFITAYSNFIKNRGLPVSISSADGTAVKSIITYLQGIETVKNGGKNPLDLWQFILDNWGKLSNWLQTQIQLRQINSQLPNIIEHLRTNGKQANNNSAHELAETLRNVIKNGSGL